MREEAKQDPIGSKRINSPTTGLGSTALYRQHCIDSARMLKSGGGISSSV